QHTASGVAARIQHHALSVTSMSIPGDHVSLSNIGDGNAKWHSRELGATRNTPFGADSIVVSSSVAEQFLTVAQHLGTKTWRWNLDTNLRPRLLEDGSVGFVPRHPGLISDLVIAPVAILDRNGRTITPHDAHWAIGGTDAHPTLELRLNDATL